MEPKVNFWARLTFLGGELRQGWRPDFFYLNEPDHGWFIWTVERTGAEWGLSDLSQDDWRNIHRDRIHPGLGFRLQEGQNLVAEGVVTRLAKE